MIIHLRRLLPNACSNLPECDSCKRGCLAACIPIWSCSRWGLPCHACYQSCGALLPPHFTLTMASHGGIFSVALSLDATFTTCTGRALPGTLFAWSPDFPPAPRGQQSSDPLTAFLQMGIYDSSVKGFL
jgi:hypothetical protein